MHGIRILEEQDHLKMTKYNSKGERWCCGHKPSNLKGHYTDVNNFTKERSKKDGLTSWCKDCARIRNKSIHAKWHPRRYGPNADPKHRATYKRNGNKHRLLRVQAALKLKPAYQAEVDSIYEFCDFMNLFDKHHVDHIIPIKADPNVCGLHTPANLRVITAQENLRRTYGDY